MRWTSFVQGAVVAGVAAAAFAVVSTPRVEGQARTAGVPRLNGKPDLNGLWQAVNSANWDIQAHTAKPALAMRPGPVVPVPAKEVIALGAVGSVPSGIGVVEGDELPYTADGLKKKLDNQQNWLTRDPEIKCYLPGVPRATYMPFPFQIVQSNAAVFMAYEYAGAVRHIYLKDPGPPQIDSWMGMSYGGWEGDTFVVHTSGFNDQSWFDRAGNHHSDKLKVTERYTMTDADHINYEATIDDPGTFTRPWKMSMPLYRRVERNAQLGQFKCVEFVTELMYRASAEGADQMRIAGLTVTAALVGLVVSAQAQAPAAPQTQGATARQAPAPTVAARPTTAKPPAVPRTADGHPDFQGNWTNATITPMERLRANVPLVLTEEAARLDESNTAAALEAREAPSDPNRSAPPVGGEVRKSPNAEPTYLELLWRAGGGAVGGYNSFWVDPGDKVLRVDGQPRSSIIIDPPNGRVPAYTDEARARLAKAAEIRKTQGSEFDHPELRPLGERCITSFGNNAGPPMLPNYFYNNSYTIVQSKDTVMILTEMVHDARIVRMNGTHPPTGTRKWFGDSIGRWEGDTLVIETTNFHPNHGFRNSWENLKVTERLSRKDAKTINYRFTVEDPSTFTTPFTGELVFNAMAPGEMVYEYACHEANYGLEGVMSGARAQEREAAKKKTQQQ